MRAALDLWAPLCCPLCGDRLAGDDGCGRCRLPAAPLCVRQLRSDRQGAYLLLGGGRFRGAWRRLLLAYKFRRDPAAGRLLARQVALAVGTGAAWDALVPIPAHPLRRRERGWEPVADLAAQVATRCDLPRRAALRRVRPTPPLAGRGRAERRRVVRAAFVAHPAQGCLLLFDDVATSGATLLAGRRALLAAGAEAVDLLAAAITPPAAGALSRRKQYASVPPARRLRTVSREGMRSTDVP